MSGPATARSAAIEALKRVLDSRQTLDEALELANRGLETRDKAFCRAIVLSALRHKGSIEFLISKYLSRPLPKSGRRAQLALLSGAAQLLFVGSPAHAVVNEQVNLIPANSKFRGVVNAVLRRIDRDGARDIADPKVMQRDLPAWLWHRWKAAYGAETTMDIIRALSRDDVPLDLSVKSDAEGWAEKLTGEVLPTGSVRLGAAGSVSELEGYADGVWWVQDTAASLPVKLFGDLAGKTLLDACSAPGGKTAQAIAAGARVTALDRSAKRLKVLAANMTRLNLSCRTVVCDLLDHRPEAPYDAVLLDAPCTATGTLRRHPDIGWNRTEEDVATLASLQSQLLDHAATLVRPGGRLVYCTCSLEPEEGEKQIDRFLTENRNFHRAPVRAAEVGLRDESVTRDGDLRTLPHHMAEKGGMDGFFAARLIRK
ncbi:RsmB/NOP family class I SAM-dependent RNA methyltransferase [Minwuia sp.]|uniref:RsmB/NOP family class I SAM-dependent RNA methyltransferase n=1 Tax=Minwuia sp. TaxID=2493630 RepID=UPI003A9157FD